MFTSGKTPHGPEYEHDNAVLVAFRDNLKHWLSTEEAAIFWLDDWGNPAPSWTEEELTHARRVLELLLTL